VALLQGAIAGVAPDYKGGDVMTADTDWEGVACESLGDAFYSDERLAYLLRTVFGRRIRRGMGQ